MRDKIIFWLDADFTHFLIAKAIQDRYDADFYAIIDITDKPKKFFQTQQLVKFKKVWFYHDHISPKNKADLSYLSSFEEKYRLNLWNLAYNERIFYQFNDYHKFSSDEILTILEQECRLFEKVLDEVKPDFLIKSDTNLHHNHLFYELCKSKGIKPLLTVSTRFAKKCAISSIADNLDWMPKKIEPKTIGRSFKELQLYLENFDTFTLAITIEKRFLSSKLGMIRAVLKFIFNDNSNVKTHYSYYGRSKLKVLIKSLINVLKTKYRNNFINQNFIHNPKFDEPFVFFPLHQEPERSLLLSAPFYTEEYEIITNIVKSLPIGYRLFIKEHPAMKARQWRKISYYKKIMSLPNVKMIHPSVNSKELIKKSSLVITISGTASFEAPFYQKPSIVLTDTSFSMLSSVYRLKSIEELPQAIRLCLKKQIDPSELSEYIDIINKNSFEFDYDDFILNFGDLFYYGSFLVDVDISEIKIKSFIEGNILILNKLAEEHIKKINEYKKSSLKM